MKANTKEELLGAVHKLPVTSGNIPKKDILEKPFASKNSVVRIHCSGCGAYSAANLEMIRTFPEFADIAHLETKDFKNKFIDVKRCLACDSGFRVGELREIDNVN